MDKTVCNFCNREVDSKDIVILKGFKEDSFLGFKGEVQIMDITICDDCFISMREQIAKKEMNLNKRSYPIRRIVP